MTVVADPVTTLGVVGDEVEVAAEVGTVVVVTVPVEVEVTVAAAAAALDPTLLIKVTTQAAVMFKVGLAVSQVMEVEVEDAASVAAEGIVTIAAPTAVVLDPVRALTLALTSARGAEAGAEV